MLTNTSGLISGYILAGDGSGKKVGWDEIAAWQPGQGFLWVHLDYTDPLAKQWLAEQSGLKKSVQRALLVEESRPRAILDDNGLLLFLRGVNLNPGQDPEDMVSIRIWADANRVITTRQRRLLSVADLEASIRSNQAPKSTSALVAALAGRLTDRMSDFVDKNSEELDALEDAGDSEKIAVVRRSVSDLRRQSIAIRRYLAPQREAINRLLSDQTGFFKHMSLIQLREIGDRTQRYIEELDSVRDRAAVIQEEISTRLSEQINSRMYVLSLVTVIFLPLGFITGLLGINVGGIPGSEFKYAFWIVVGLLVGLSAVFMLLLRRKGWF